MLSRAVVLACAALALLPAAAGAGQSAALQ
jgi:hypothetical protein